LGAVHYTLLLVVALLVSWAAKGVPRPRLPQNARKLIKAKKKAAEDKKAASIERKAKAVEQAAAKKQARQDKQVLAAEAKATHALSKAAELCARIAKEGAVVTAPIKGSAKKIKDSEGSPIFSAELPITLFQSPQRNKRVSVQSPQRAPSPMNESKDSFDDSSGEVLTIGEDTLEEGSGSFRLSSAENFARKAVARGGYRYGAPPARRRSKSPPVNKVNSASPSQSSGSSANSQLSYK
jgi:Sec-independent protein translocase protein TatA